MTPEESEIANVPHFEEQVMAAAGMEQAPESRIRVIASNSHEAKERRKKHGLKMRRPFSHPIAKHDKAFML